MRLYEEREDIVVEGEFVELKQKRARLEARARAYATAVLMAILAFAPAMLAVFILPKFGIRYHKAVADQILNNPVALSRFVELNPQSSALDFHSLEFPKVVLERCATKFWIFSALFLSATMLCSASALGNIEKAFPKRYNWQIMLGGFVVPLTIVFATAFAGHQALEGCKKDYNSKTVSAKAVKLVRAKLDKITEDSGVINSLMSYKVRNSQVGDGRPSEDALNTSVKAKEVGLIHALKVEANCTLSDLLKDYEDGLKELYKRCYQGEDEESFFCEYLESAIGMCREIRSRKILNNPKIKSLADSIEVMTDFCDDIDRVNEDPRDDSPNHSLLGRLINLQTICEDAELKHLRPSALTEGDKRLISSWVERLDREVQATRTLIRRCELELPQAQEQTEEALKTE